MSDLTHKLVAEALRTEEDCNYSSKGHYYDSKRWIKYHLLAGLPASILSAAAGVSAFNSETLIAGISALLATVLTTTLTFLKPSERAENHRSAAGQYLALRNQTRMFREIDLEETGFTPSTKARLAEFAKKRDELNQTCPAITQKSYKLAKKDIDAGYSTHQTDKKKT